MKSTVLHKSFHDVVFDDENLFFLLEFDVMSMSLSFKV